MTTHVNDEGESSPGDMSLDIEGIERLLEDPVLRTRLAAVIREQLEESPAVWRRVGPLLATQDSTTLTSAATSFGVAATLAPRCCKGRVCSRVRLYTVRSKWAASNRLAMRLPMAPVPMNPTRSPGR